MAESRIKRYARYVKYVGQWVFLEKARGLDFTMRDTALLDKSGGVMHGYSKTDESHAKAIFDSLNVDSSMRLLDVGCGKGAFLREACKESFGEIAGIEYVDELAYIAKRNFKRLGLNTRVKIYCGDATRFKAYSQYNVIYFFNPFDAEIMEKVMDRIREEQTERTTIILHHPTAEDVVISHGGKEINRLYDKVKSYETIIYMLD